MQRTAFSLLARSARPTAQPLARTAARPVARKASTAAHDPHAAAAGEHYPQEGAPLLARASRKVPQLTLHHGVRACGAGFNAPFWRRLSLGALAVFIYLRAAPDDLPSKALDAAEDKAPAWMTRYIEHNLRPDADKFKARNERHLELAKQAADDKLLFQEAERPRVRRMRYLGCGRPSVLRDETRRDPTG